MTHANLVHETEQRPRVTSVLIPSPRLWTGLRVGQSLNPVLPALCFSQSSGLWPRMEEVPHSHRTAYIPARDLSQVGKSRKNAQKKQSNFLLSSPWDSHQISPELNSLPCSKRETDPEHGKVSAASKFL